MPPANGGSSTPPDTLPADFGNWDANPPDVIPRQLKPLRTFSSAMHYNLGAPPPARTPAQAVQQQVNQAVGTVPSPTRLLDVAGAYPGTMPSKVPTNWTGNAQPVPLGASDVASIATDVLAPGTMMPGKADLSPGEETPGQTVGRGVGQLLTSGQRTTGALRTIAGATEAAAPLAGPFAVENPLGFLRAIGEGWLTGKAAKKAASALNASEEQQGLAEQVGQAAPMLYHAALHPEIAQGHTPEGNPVGQATVMGKYGGGVEITPDEVVLRGGSTENPKEIRIPRRPRSPALEPPTIEGQTTAPSEPTQTQALAGGPEATPSRNLAPAPPEAPQSPIPAPIRALATAGVSRKPPQTVGTVQGAQRDTELFQQAQRENPNGTVSQWAQRAQELKQQDEQPPQQALHSPATAEDDMEAARRGAAGAPPSDRVQRATDLVNSLTMQLDRERAAGDPGQYLTVSHLSNAQDALQVAQSSDQLFAGKRPSKEVQGHNAAVGSMLLDVTHPPQSIDWNVVKPGRGLPSALELNDAARELVAKSIGTRGFGGMSASPETLDQEVLPRLEMAAQAMDNTRAQRSDYFDPQASAKLRQLAQAIQENRGPEGLSFTRSEGTPEQQRYTTHEELFHTAVQRRPAGGVGLRVPDISDSAGMELMRPRIYKETGRMTSIVHHAEGMADIMQGRAPELTPEQAGQTAEDYWDQLAATGPSGVKGLLDAWRLENFMDDDQESKGYTLDDNVHAIRQAGRDALARVLSRHFGENLRGLARALREEPEGGNVSRAQGSPNPANDVPPANGPPDLGSAAANTGGESAGPSSGAVAPPQQASLFNEKQRVSTRRPTGVTSTEDPMKQDLQINTQAIRDAGLEKSMADRVREYVGQKNLSGTPSEILDGFKKHLTDNLVWLHNQLPENFRAQSKQWYDGANKLAGDWSKQYSNDEQKVSKPQVAGVIASLSPQKDWHMNVSLAQRTIDTYLNHQDTPFSPEMKAASQRLAQTPSLRPDLKQIAGKTLSDLSDPIQKAMWIRLYDEAHNSRSYNVYAPDGSVSDLARNQDGAPSKVAWGSNAMTAKAISILEDGSRQNISDQLGDMHKVRNFYNNIVAPNSKSGDVTIDTHAVAAAHLRPLAGGDIEVQHNFGNTNKGTEGVGQSQIAGIKGTYGIYADAYRAAAEKLGVLPRELQSMTWEGIRSLFPAEYKTAANKAIIDGIWSDYQNGKLSIAQARRQVVKAAGGFTPPEWAAGGRSDAGAHEAAGPAPESPDVSGAGVHGQPTGSAPSRGGSSSARAVSESVNPSASPVPQFLKRAARPNVSSR